MSTAINYVDNWLRNKPPGLSNYLNYNLHRKMEICYIFRLRSYSTASLATFFKRGKQVRNFCL